MRIFILASIAVVACSLGCDRQPAKKVDNDAPGVKVNVDPDGGVKVQAPGVDVDTTPAGGPKVNVGPDRAK
jgi:hypothetical protein